MKEAFLTVYIIMMNTFAMMDIWLLLKIFFGCDMNISRKTLALSAGGFVLVDVLLTWLLYDQELLLFTGMLGYEVIATFVLTKRGRLRAALYAIPAVLVYLQFDSLLKLLEKLFHLDAFYVTYNETSKLTPLSAICELLLFVILLLVDRRLKKKNVQARLSALEAVGVSIFCMFCPFLSETFSYLEQQEAGFPIGLEWTVFMIALNLLFVFGIVHRKRAVYYRSVSEDNSDKFNDEYDAFQEYKSRNEETAKFRHDLNSHMIILQQLLKEQRYDDAQTYFEEMSAGVSSAAIHILTGNELLDMVLGTKYGRLLEKDIEIRLHGRVEGLTFISPADLCIIFSNLLDNAIEAVEKLPDNRWIEISCKKTEGAVFFEMKNPVLEKVQLQNGRPVTTKADQQNHGFGLENVETAVNKYRGQCRIELTDQCFSHQIIVPAA